MKYVDILFLYETKVRELENICLLKYELERRGYSVAILNTWNSLGQKKSPYKAKVVVTHAMYHDGIYQFVTELCGKVPKVVNMQCEQVGTIQDEQQNDSRMILRGVAKQCMNICWGDRTYQRLQKAGFDEKHLAKTGQITLDFCRPEFRGYYLPKDEILKKYHLDERYQINLFVSSFAYVSLPQQIEKNSEILEKDTFIRISQESFLEILNWFDRMLADHPEQGVVYRPHPAEAGHAKLKEMEEKYPGRFYVISELSVKQWFSVADRVYTWYSTAAAEAYRFSVPIVILRPVKMPEMLEVSLYENAHLTEKYEEFESTLTGDVSDSICPKIFSELYYTEEKFSYLLVADAIEITLQSDEYLIQNPPRLPERTTLMRIKGVAHKAASMVANLLPKSVHSLDKYRDGPIVSDEYTVQRQRNNYASEEEIEKIKDRIAQLLK